MDVVRMKGLETLRTKVVGFSNWGKHDESRYWRREGLQDMRPVVEVVLKRMCKKT